MLAELPVPTTDPEAIRAVTEAVLSRPEFADARRSWFDAFWAAVADVVSQLLAMLVAGGRGPWIGTAVLLVACAAVAILAGVFLRRMQRSHARAVPIVGWSGRTAGQWRADALAAEDQRRWREALRCHHRALIAQLAAAGFVDDAPGRTAGEYVDLVAGELPTARDDFVRATRTFEAAWYGQVPVSEEALAAFKDDTAAVRTAAGLRP